MREPLFFVQELEDGKKTTLFFGPSGVDRFFRFIRKLGRLW